MESVLDISAHKYGNYHKYYTFHPSSARSSFFASGDMFRKLWEAQDKPRVFRILDIGCNEGNLSMDVLEQARWELPSSVVCTVLGIDIDSSLIALANEKYCAPKEGGVVPPHIAFDAINFMDADATGEFMTGYFDELNKATQSASADCNSFRGFNVVCLFSITMWIHLNHDDTGLVDCLQRSAGLLTPTGSLVIEPQPWKCYKAADKRCRKLGITRPLHYSALAIRNIEVDLVNIMMQDASKLSLSLQSDVEPVPETERAAAAAAAKKHELAATADVMMKMVSTNMHMQSYWDLGKEGWGRSILIFHRSSELGWKLEKTKRGADNPELPSSGFNNEQDAKRTKFDL